MVVDCNVLVSAAMSPSTCRRCLSEIARSHTWLYSRATLQEFLEVAQYTHIKPYFPRVKKIIKVMLRLGVEVRPVDDPVDLPDPDDAVYLQTALAGQADILITGNRKHFPFEEYRGICIVSPGEFLMLTQEQGENE